MTMIARITKTYTRLYTDTGQHTSYVEWLDWDGNPGRTEGPQGSTYMRALLARAKREGIETTREVW